MKHLVLFDGPCPLCHKALHMIAKRDKKKLFAYAALQGKTAERFSLPACDTVVLIEDFESDPQIFIEGKAVRRIAKHLGYFIPFPTWLYRLIARNRYKLCKRPRPFSSDILLP